MIQKIILVICGKQSITKKSNRNWKFETAGMREIKIAHKESLGIQRGFDVIENTAYCYSNEKILQKKLCMELIFQNYEIWKKLKPYFHTFSRWRQN